MRIIKVVYAALAAIALSGASSSPLVHAVSPHKTSTSIHQASQPVTLGDYYTNRQPPTMETLFLPDALRGQSGTAGGAPHGDGNIRIATYNSPSSFKAVCQFYINRLLPPGANPQALGVEGDLKKQSSYSIEERPGISAAKSSLHNFGVRQSRSARQNNGGYTDICTKLGPCVKADGLLTHDLLMRSPALPLAHHRVHSTHGFDVFCSCAGFGIVRQCDADSRWRDFAAD